MCILYSPSRTQPPKIIYYHNFMRNNSLIIGIYGNIATYTVVWCVRPTIYGNVVFPGEIVYAGVVSDANDCTTIERYSRAQHKY